MKTYYMTALTPPRGAEGDLNKFREACGISRCWNSPLPLAAPLNLFNLPFPRDRVNPAGLRKLPPLILEGPELKKGHIILSMKNPAVFRASENLFRTIHGKSIPPAEENTFIHWTGLLLAPANSYPPSKTEENDHKKVHFEYRTWQLGLYKIRYDEHRLWWEDFSWSCLWLVRKPLE